MSSVKVQGETYRSSEELLDAMAELERARDNSPEYGPKRPQIETHLNSLRSALRTLKENEAAASEKASARADRDASRATAQKSSARAAASKRRSSQARDFYRGSRRDVSRASSATGVDQPIGDAGDFALSVIGWTLLTVLFFVLINPKGKGPQTVSAFSGGAQKFLDRLLDPSTPLISYAGSKPSVPDTTTATAATVASNGVAGLAVGAATGKTAVLLAQASKLVGNAKATIKGTPNAKGSTHDPNAAPNNWESDNAYDIAVKKGTPIYAAAAGTIGSQIGSLGTSGRFEGIRVHLVTAANEYYYAHLSKLAPGIKAGVTVKAGQLLGYSGVANGLAHLHFASKAGDPLLG
jgi:murein DD-endopeptidase MepM/ murein hydrolase activator NlpD